MERHRSLRMTLLLAAGAAGCSNAKSPEIAVVTLGEPQAATPRDAGVPDEQAAPAPRPPRGVGWVEERDGTVHRATRVRCDATIDQRACSGTERTFQCRTDADCKEGPRGTCVSSFGQIGAYCGCEYSCESDAECGASEACVCKGTGALREQHSVCAKALCSVDADCPGSTCGLSAYFNGCWEQVTLACRTKEDTCLRDADCRSSDENRGAACVVTDPEAESARWECAGISCAIGRPFVVDGQPRAAQGAARDDWRAPAELDVASLSPEVRELAAAHYAAVAALEHASIASFARFSLQLLTLGAPAALVGEAHRAALDEVEHARLAYGVASRLAGRAIGPGPLLEAATAPLGASVAEVVEALVEEGCVGEALGAAEGREIAQRAGDPALAATLARIAADEERHAALSWRALSWMLATFGGPARSAAERAFSRAAARYAVDPAPGPAVHEALGLLPARALGALRREVLAEVIAPCRAALPGLSRDSVAAQPSSPPQASS
ncbi:ferritin-like domain-containing protein [Sorangium sp. So ce1504]|uniref:ferritin-like domain-containing protein n=1 Tax=Sorangium sp. So ce1504 TaxID=3133337 RepID=UPI003F5ED6B8